MRVMAVPLATVALTSVLLYPRGPIYRLATWSQLACYGLAAAGLGLARRGVGHHPLLALPAYFCMVQAASLHATWNLIRGVSYDRWQPERGATPGARAGSEPVAGVPEGSPAERDENHDVASAESATAEVRAA